MKALFVPIFAVLTVVVRAEQYASSPVYYSSVPMINVAAIDEKSLHRVTSGNITTVPQRAESLERLTPLQVATPTSYTVKKPTEKPFLLPLPPEPLAPLLPTEDYVENESPTIIRGQARTVDELAGYLDSPVPLPQGTVDVDAIDQKLIEIPEPLASEGMFGTSQDENLSEPSLARKEATATDPLGYAVLLTATVITTIGLVYMAFVAYDYRQRWMQSLMTQNDRYLGGGTFDMEMEESYGTYNGGSVAFPEGLGLSRHSI